jgi:hypothetical protein
MRESLIDETCRGPCTVGVIPAQVAADGPIARGAIEVWPGGRRESPFATNRALSRALSRA